SNGAYTHFTVLNHIFFFYDPASTQIYTLSLHDALPIFADPRKHGLNGIAIPMVLVAEFTDCPICLPIVNAPHESEQSTLGKRRLHAHCRDHARKRRGARATTRNHKRI